MKAAVQKVYINSTSGDPLCQPQLEPRIIPSFSHFSFDPKKKKKFLAVKAAVPEFFFHCNCKQHTVAERFQTAGKVENMHKVQCTWDLISSFQVRSRRRGR